MSAGEEFTTITSCVDAITKRYNDAAEIIQRVKAARADKQAPAPSRYLEETIQCAPEDVTKEKDRGIGRFGLAFQQGDESALTSLRSVNRELDKLLEELQRLAKSEELADFKHLVDEVDCSRDHAIDALIKLRQGCLATETEQTQSRSSSDASTSQRELPSPPAEPVKTYHFPQHHNPWLRMHRSHTSSRFESKDISDAEDTQAGAEHHHKKHGHGSILHFLKHHRAHSHETKGNDSGNEEGARRFSRAIAAPQTHPLVTSNNNSVVSLDPTQPWWSQDADSTSPTLQRQSSEMSHRDSHASVDTVVGISPTAQSYRSRAASTATSIFRTSSLAIPTPTQDNDYLGFCKAAVRLQNGDKKAMEKRREYSDAWSQATVYYLACSSNKCAFAGHIDVNVIMTKLFVMDAKGLQFRWPFLAKSHVLQHKVKDNAFSYQCLFCVFSGERSAIYHGSDSYINHVSTHRGDVGAVILYKARCINDHIADASEEFDINLFPLNSGEARSRRASEMLADDMMLLQMSPYSSAKNDSVLSAKDEPWNEGLSDFHYKDDLFSGEMG